MLRVATEQDLASIHALIKSVPGFWHAEWRPDVLNRALDASGGLAFVWEEDGKLLGFSCTHTQYGERSKSNND